MHRCQQRCCLPDFYSLEGLIVPRAKAVYHGAEENLEVVAAREGVAHRKAHLLDGLGAQVAIMARSLQGVVAHHPPIVEDGGDEQT